MGVGRRRARARMIPRGPGWLLVGVRGAARSTCMIPIASARSNLPWSIDAHSSRDIFSSSFCLRPSTSLPLFSSAAFVADVSRKSATVPAASACHRGIQRGRSDVAEHGEREGAEG